jgi:hypothetical protein
VAIPSAIGLTVSYVVSGFSRTSLRFSRTLQSA